MEFFNDIGSDPHRPSLFELVTQEQLRDLLQPAIKYVFGVLAQRHPRYLLQIVNRHEEFYACIMFFVEWHYLKSNGASFAESFYGLKRRRKPLINPERANAAVGAGLCEGSLRPKDIRNSLVFIIGVPYIRAKAQDLYEQLGGGADSDILNQTVTGVQQLPAGWQAVPVHVKQLFKLLYPWANTGFELWLMAWDIAYLFDKTSFYRPWLAWTGIDLRRVGFGKLRANVSADRHSAQALHKGLLASLRRFLISSPKLLLDSLKVLLPISIIFIKFLEWWYSPSSPARTLTRPPSGPTIPPPLLVRPHPQGIPMDDVKYGVCPICTHAIVNATALPSGYVFCYRCAYPHVEQHGKCPVTLLPARIWQLRKVLI